MLAGAVSREEWAQTAKKVEALGYATLLMPDHFSTQFAPVPALVAAAEATSRLRVGSFVFDNDFRHPALLAREAATIDVLTGGRFELGLGAGWKATEYAQAGIAFDSPGIRVGRMEEGLQVLKRLWAGSPADFTGRHYQISELDGLPKPVQQPHPPILIGGGGRRVLSIAAREADIVSLAPRVTPQETADPASLTISGTDQKVKWIREAAGARFGELELNIYFGAPVLITGDRRSAARAVADQRRASYGVSEDVVLESPHFAIGTVDQIVEDLRARRDRFHLSYVVVGRGGPSDIDAFAPVVERLAGT